MTTIILQLNILQIILSKPLKHNNKIHYKINKNNLSNSKQHLLIKIH